MVSPFEVFRRTFATARLPNLDADQGSSSVGSHRSEKFE
jgi:hypothetical protein